MTAVNLTLALLRFCFHNSCFTSPSKWSPGKQQIADVKLDTSEYIYKNQINYVTI